MVGGSCGLWKVGTGDERCNGESSQNSRFGKVLGKVVPLHENPEKWRNNSKKGLKNLIGVDIV